VAFLSILLAAPSAEGVARNRPVNHLVLTTLRKFRKLTAAFLVKIRPSISK
jgi:hypothetical protein